MIQSASAFVLRSWLPWPVTLLLAFWLFGLPGPAHAEAVEPTRSVSDGPALIRKGAHGDMCTLTFDDGPGRYTATLLDTLKERGIPATFFVVGTQAKQRPALIRRMVAEGHEVGNHSYSHGSLKSLTAEEQEADLRKMDELLRELGAEPRFIRPPYGFYDHNTVNVVKEMNGHIVMWSVDSQDWRSKGSSEDMLANMQTLYAGAPLRGVFLFHDTHQATVENMPQILDALLEGGCRFVTLSEYIDAAPQTTQAAVTETKPATAVRPAESVENRVRNESDRAASRIMGWILGNMLLLPEKGNSLPH